MPDPVKPSMFTEASLHNAVQQAIQSATIPDHHGFAALVDLHGARVGLATRVGDGWAVNMDAGYTWDRTEHGASASISVGKTW